jgi:uncharacterized protein DUF7002
MEMTEQNFDLGVTPEAFSSLYPRLYHMAHEDAWPQIQHHGLLSTRSILDLWEVETAQRARVEGQIRPAAVELSHPRHGKVVIRDQKPLNEKKLRAALTDCTPQDWCRLLNGKVFFWPCIDRLNTHMAARGNRGKIHLVLMLDSYRFVKSYEQQITLCAMNSGNTNPFPQKRGKSSFMRMSQYPFAARRKRGAYYTVVELAVDTDIPDILDFVLTASSMTSNGEVSTVIGDSFKTPGVGFRKEIAET